MKLPVLALAGGMLPMMPSVQAAQMMAAPDINRLVQEAHVTRAYLTEDGYCVRPHRKQKYWKPKHHYRQVYRTYESQPSDEYQWRYEHPRPIIRVVPNYPPQDEDDWDDSDD
ncbi:hypothetical protein [Mesorhizobium sp. CA7]|uniref:hypothetical protein n=1 Tax=Mesorhizobium sp. CA7 TaxID=588501 RepID=UPI001CCE5BA1|nr:hypothetical protein [Mesorhizobium sp. CA7]MBZ9815172.1 hypothetical protein [Mesorhizobium sp. CA7]